MGWLLHNGQHITLDLLPMLGPDPKDPATILPDCILQAKCKRQKGGGGGSMGQEGENEFSKLLRQYLSCKANVQQTIPHLLIGRFWPPLGYSCSKVHSGVTW